MRRGFDGLAADVAQVLRADPYSGAVFVFRSRRGQRPTFRFATIAYRCHPLAGRRVRVAPFRRGKELKCIYTDERPGLCRELPN